jgi:actin
MKHEGDRECGFQTDCNPSDKLPDGKEITIVNERVQCPELLFKLSFNGFEFDWIDQTLFDSIMKCDGDVRKHLSVNIVLSGGITMFQELPEHDEKEITRLAPATMKIKVVVPPERKYAVWIGRSILTFLTTFPQMVIIHEEYHDAEREIIHRRCFQTAGCCERIQFFCGKILMKHVLIDIGSGDAVRINGVRASSTAEI